jgi:hypothetical protein
MEPNILAAGSKLLNVRGLLNSTEDCDCAKTTKINEVLTTTFECSVNLYSSFFIKVRLKLQTKTPVKIKT